MNTRFTSVAIKKEILERIKKIASSDCRSIPKTIEVLILAEEKRREINSQISYTKNLKDKIDKASSALTQDLVKRGIPADYEEVEDDEKENPELILDI